MQNLFELFKPYRVPLVLLLLVLGRMVIFGDAVIPVGEIFNRLTSSNRNAPRLKIKSPIPDAIYQQGQSILFIGHGLTRCSQIRWLSSIDGQFQEGQIAFSYDKLTRGPHTITLIARCGSLEMSAGVAITVQPLAVDY